ncbi:MAG: peptidoglycan DD-metalloendopeptidase family protein [Halioglobus sp.]
MRRWLLYSLVVCCLVACGGNKYRAPVEDRRIQPKPVPASYSVQRGDTLFSIAWRYGLDYRAVADSNSIPSPYTIYPGQKIYLGASPPPKPKKSTAATVTTPKASTKPAVAATPPPVAKTPSTTSNKSSSGANTNSKVTRWRWPTAGRVTRGYSSTVHKGIDIDGKRGDAIYAVASGKVVYAGTGIVGYGELLIVKHNEIYLSAYGHNSRLLAREGDQIKAGQKIAEKGSSGTDTVKLHFEIRKEGKPIDPKRILPAR